MTQPDLDAIRQRLDLDAHWRATGDARFQQWLAPEVEALLAHVTALSAERDQARMARWARKP